MAAMENRSALVVGVAPMRYSGAEKSRVPSALWRWNGVSISVTPPIRQLP